MKRLFCVLACALFLAAFGPVPSASASWWPFKHHAKSAQTSTDSTADPNAQPSKKSKSMKSAKTKKSKHSQDNPSTGNSGHLYGFPKSVGWWHKGPGPAGAGVK
jgi:hypothetical protein